MTADPMLVNHAALASLAATLTGPDAAEWLTAHDADHR